MRDEKIITHREIRIGDSTIMFADSTEKFEPRTTGLFIYVENADETYEKAIDEGATTIMGLSDQDDGRTCGGMSATILYGIGVFGVTVSGNVPLNETLANFSIDGASPEKLLSHREKFESRWNQYYFVRTAASILCFSMTIRSLLIVRL